MKCPICGRENFDPNNFCYNCGYCLNSSLKSVKRMRRDKTTFLAVIILLAIICVGLAGFILYYGQKYRTLTNNNKALTGEVAEMEEAYDKLDSQVYIPDDWNYVYHKFDCTAYDHDLACFVMSEEEAKELGCTPCPECIK